jgi:hypothetical protein
VAVSDESTVVRQRQLDGLTGDAEARQRLLELTRDRLMRRARRFLHGRYPRREPFEQTDDVVQHLYLKNLQNQDVSGSMPTARRCAPWRTSSATRGVDARRAVDGQQHRFLVED